MNDHDLTNERLIPMVIALHKFADIKMGEGEAVVFLSNLSLAEKMNIVTAHKQVIGH